MIGDKLRIAAEMEGLWYKTFKAEHLKEISSHIEQLAAQGLINEAFYKTNLTSFNYDYKSALENAKSVIVLAAPQVKSLAIFEHHGKNIETVIPPTYLYPGISTKIANMLKDVIEDNGFHFARPALPLKLLAVKSGLGRYGRNNVCYIPGLGSFFRLAAYVTDYEFAEDSWGEIKLLDSCSTCEACLDACPTGAIEEGRFIIHAENCITNMNEYETPIPEWVEPHWHDSIVGCMKCQAACPHNKKQIDLINDRVAFDEKETTMILDGVDFSNLPLETKNKLSYAGLETYYTVLPRNLRLLIRE